jgi:hypothetical protein
MRPADPPCSCRYVVLTAGVSLDPASGTSQTTAKTATWAGQENLKLLSNPLHILYTISLYPLVNNKLDNREPAAKAGKLEQEI